MAKLILTDERQRGLAVLLAADRATQQVYTAKATTDPDRPGNGHLTIDSRTVAWLRDRGFVTTSTDPSTTRPAPASRRVRPTDRGLQLAQRAAALGATANPERGGLVAAGREGR